MIKLIASLLVSQTFKIKGLEITLTEGGQVGDVVVDVFDGEAEDLDAHPADVRSGDLADEGGELVAVLVDLLDGQRS